MNVRTRNVVMGALASTMVLAPIGLGTTAIAAAARAHGHPPQASTAPLQKHHHSHHFTAVGKVSNVGDGTLTIVDKGGSKDLHGQTVTVTVSSSTRIKRNHTRVDLAALQVGDHVAVNGQRSGADLAARHIVAKGPNVDSADAPDPAEASDSPSDS